MPSTVFLDRAINTKNPETFGRYQLLGRVAVGGMAEVYVARCGDLAGMQSVVALKRILPVHANDEGFVRMFKREAAIALRLQHSSIARVFEVGKVDDSWFLSMELVQGENLSRVTKRLRGLGTPWSFDLLAFILSEAARALDYAHGLRDAKGRHLGIVHRDISPENVMLGFDGAVKVIDFGIALCEMYARETTAGAVRGKVQYVSPEQALGRSVDNRSDIFSLGVVLYELLAGTHPFERVSAMATLDAVVKDEPPPLPLVPDALAAVVTRALSKDPNTRYQTAGEMSAALLGAIHDRTTTGAAEVADLVSSLFPGRTGRWKQIQEMAGAGLGFLDDFNTPEPQPVSSSMKTTVQRDYVATLESQAADGAPSRRRSTRLVAVASAALVALVGISVSALVRSHPRADAAPVQTAAIEVEPLLPAQAASAPHDNASHGAPSAVVVEAMPAPAPPTPTENVPPSDDAQPSAPATAAHGHARAKRHATGHAKAKRVAKKKTAHQGHG